MAAFLIRQELEEAIDAFWEDRVPDFGSTTMRTKLIALEAYIDPAMAAQTSQTWAVLSNVCHYRGYSLEPTGEELTSWLTTAGRLIRHLRNRPETEALPT